LVALVVAGIWGAGRILQTLAPVLWPIAVAGVLAYLLDPLVDFLETRRVPRARAILLVFLVALAIVVALVGSVVPQLVRETRDLAQRVPGYAENIQHRMERWVNDPPPLLRRIFDRPAASTNAAPTIEPSATPPSTNSVAVASAPATIDWAELLGGERVKSATDWLVRAVGRLARWLFGQFNVVASFFGVVAGLALVPVYTFYLLLEKRGIQSHWTDYLPLTASGLKDELVFVLRSINDYLIVFFRGQVLVAMCDGALYALGFYLIGLPYALLLGVMAVPLTIIPFLGAIITCVAALILAAVTHGDWLHPLLVLGVFGVVQSLEGLA
jgi:predicted PurR-regulated permease PerM